MVVDGEQVTMRDKGKGREIPDVVMTMLMAPDSKWCKISLKVMPAHHLAMEGESGDSMPPPPKKQKNKSALARMTPSSAVVALNQTPAKCPSVMCKNCAAKGHAVCWTTALQIACSACHAGKTECSYSAACVACWEARIASGELPGKKASGQKKVQPDQGSEVKGKGGKAAEKRKWQSETADKDPSIDNVASGLGSTDQPYQLNIDAPPTLRTSTQPATISTNTGAAPAPQVGCTPMLCCMQCELNNICMLMATFTVNQEKLMSEVVMLQGWVEVVMTLKEDMLVHVPALQAELRGLRNGMDLERVKGVVATLQTELANTNQC